MAKTALVTGASSGIGFEFSKILASEGYNLVMVARTDSTLQKSADAIKSKYSVTIKTIVRDLSRPESADLLYNQLVLERIIPEVLINNAGFATFGEFLDTPLSDQMQMIELNISSLTRLCHLVGKEMSKSGKGKILNISSTAAFSPGPMMSVYFASKAYVLSLSEALHEELKEYGITVSVLCPGPTETGFFQRANFKGIKFFKNFMDAETVATAGYRGLLKGKKVIVPGLTNKFLVNSMRIFPRSITARLIKRLGES